MKSVKITKLMLKHPQLLLKKSGAFYQRQGFPNHVYMNPKDYLQLKKNLTKAFKKKYPYLSSLKIKACVGLEMLNYGPVILKGIQKGFLLVNDKAIELESQEKKA